MHSIDEVGRGGCCQPEKCKRCVHCEVREEGVKSDTREEHLFVSEYIEAEAESSKELAISGETPTRYAEDDRRHARNVLVERAIVALSSNPSS